MSSRYIVKKSKFKKPSNSILAQKRQQKQTPSKKKDESEDSDDGMVIREKVTVEPVKRFEIPKPSLNLKRPPSKENSPQTSESSHDRSSSPTQPTPTKPATTKLTITNPTLTNPTPTNPTTTNPTTTNPTTTKSEKKAEDDEDEPPKKKIQVNKPTLKRAIEIIKEIDPNQKKSLLKLEEILRQKLQDGVDNLLDYGAIQYLLESFDLDNKLKDWEDTREEQDVKYKAKKLKKEVFHGRVNLDLPKSERLPDENDRIYKAGKSIYTGAQQKYKNPKLQDRKKVQAFKNFTANKRDPKALKKFGI